jgi:hypothetical protein
MDGEWRVRFEARKESQDDAAGQFFLFEEVPKA